MINLFKRTYHFRKGKLMTTLIILNPIIKKGEKECPQQLILRIGILEPHFIALIILDQLKVRKKRIGTFQSIYQINCHKEDIKKD